MKILIKGARVIDPLNTIDAVQDVLVNGNLIVRVGDELTADNAEVIMAHGKFLVPGLVDIHVHLREPGREHKETIHSGCRAAAAGGFTTVCCMPNTLPPIDSASTVEFVLSKAATAVINCYPIAAITVGQRGETLTNASGLKTAGAIAFSDDGEPVSNSRLLYEALIASKEHGLPIIVHCEDKHLAGKGAMHEGYRSMVLNIPGIPAAAEDAMVARDLTLAELSGGRLHIAHVSTQGAITLIRQAKDRGVNVTCEVTPHHLCLTHDHVNIDDANTKMNPPLRTHEDVAALRKALQDGTIDCIATDHAPHHSDEKAQGYNEAPFGIVGLETALPLMVTELVLTNVISLTRLVQLMSANPARILDLECGEIIPQGLADLTLIDLDTTRQVNSSRFYSLGHNTPFDGKNLRGWPVMTMVSGKIVMKDGVVVHA
ncbi:MAG: dihydroorotase [Bacillota bacterium]|nr:MAG: dihydroorotase [Bacillota bacterium]